MFNIANLINPSKLKLWIENNKDELSQINDSYCYTLDISRPFWFDQQSQNKIKNMPVFVGDTYEEIFSKMYEYCLANLNWKEGGNVDLIDYHSLNKLLETDDIIIKGDDSYYLYEHDDEHVKLTKSNFHLIENDVIQSIFYYKLYFYGFTENVNSDCCFVVRQHPIY